MSHIIPLYKNGKRFEIQNYRGISILSSIPKLFEAIICNFVAFQVKDKISNAQHGFIKNRFTTKNQLEFRKSVIEAMESGCWPDTIYVDFSKAFTHY